MNIYVVDVGHGNSTIISSAEATHIVDAGRGAHVSDFLLARGLTTVDAVVLSHSDADHVGGLLALLGDDKGIDVHAVYLNVDQIKDSRLWDDVLYTIRTLALDDKVMLRQSIGLSDRHADELSCKAYSLEVIGPDPYLVGRGPGAIEKKGGRKITANSLSVTIRVIRNNQVLAVLPGDLDDIGLEYLCEWSGGEPSPCEVLVFPHHGGRCCSGDNSKFSKEILSVFPAPTIIFSIGDDNTQFPRQDILDGFKSENCRLCATGHSLTLAEFSSRYGGEVQNGVGTVAFDFTEQQPIVSFIGNS